MLTLIGTLDDVATYNVAFRISRYAVEIRVAFLAGFFPVLIKRVQKGPIDKSRFQISSLLLFFAVLFFAFIFSFISEEVIALFFSEKYRSSGNILSVLVYFIAFDFAIYPYILLLLSSNNEKYVAFIYIILVFVNIFLNYTFYQYWGAIGIAYSTLSVMVVFAFLTYVVGVKRLVHVGAFK